MKRQIFRWLYAVIGLVAILIGCYGLGLRIKNANTSAIDFKQDHIAAQNLLAGRSIYANTVNKNNHPPFAAFLAVPLAYFTYPQAITIWSIVTILMFFALGWIVMKELKFTLAPEYYFVLIGVAICWYPFFGHIGIGQLSIIICLSVVGAWALLRHGRDFTGGLLLGLACSVKLYPGLLLVVLLLRRRWRAVWGAIVFLMASLILILVIIKPHDLWLYVTQIMPQDAKEWATFPINFSIYGFFGKLFRDSPWIKPITPSPTLASTLSLLCSLALAVYLIYQVYRMPRTLIGDDTAYAVTSLGMLIISPVIWFHALLLLPLQFGLLLYDIDIRKNQRLLLLCLFAFLLLSIPDVYVADSMMAFFAPYRMPWYASLLLLTPDAGILLLWYLLNLKLEKSSQI